MMGDVAESGGGDDAVDQAAIENELFGDGAEETGGDGGDLFDPSTVEASEDTGGIVTASDDQDGVDEDPNPDGDEAEGTAPELHEVTIDGETFEVTTEELKAGYGRMRAATKKFQEAAQGKREVQEFVGRLRSGDVDTIAALFGRIGLDFDAIAEQHLSRKLEELQMPEHERGRRQLARERAELERQRQEMQRQSQEAQIQRQAAQERQRLEGEIAAAFEAHGVAKTQMLEAAVTREMLEALNAGHMLTPQDAVAMVLEDVQTRLRSMDRSQLEKILGREQAQEMQRQAGQEAARQQRAKRAEVAKRPPAAQRSQRPIAVNPDDPDALHALFDS